MLDKNFPFYAIIFILSFALTALLEKNLIPTLRNLARQPIYTDGPKWHIKKSGTPTMGGIAFISAILISLSLVVVFLFIKKKQDVAVSLIITIVFCLLNATVGIIDDLAKLKQHKNEGGLKPRQKLILHFLLASIFLAARKYFLADGAEVSFSFGGYDFGYLYYPISLILIVGIINCANLTDGVDGLATGVAFAISVAMFYISCSISEEVSFISSAVMGAAAGFLIFNLHPAKVFMGDTGSLFFGALAISCAYALNNPFIIFFLGIVYIIEGVSVIVQVVFYKLTKKRILKMAPIHHHLEQCGWSENTICIVAILLTLIASIPAYILYLP